MTSNPRLPFDVDEAADKDKQARERAQSFPELDHDWDVPAFSRKQQ